MTPDHLNTAAQGLTTAQASQRLAQDGPNDISSSTQRTVWRRLLDLLRQPMLALLVIAALLYLSLGDLTEGLILAVFVLAVLGLGFYQEGRSEAAIEALRQLTQPSAQVLRSGQIQKISARHVVVGDWLVLAEGDRVAADGELMQSNNLQIDESLLTGESVPVDKVVANAASTPGAKPLANALPPESLVNAGTFIVRGTGMAHVTATGMRSQVGQIGLALHTLAPSASPLQLQTARLVKVLAILVGVLCVGMVLILGWRTGQWVPALLSGVALAMSILPEEYSVVLAIFPAMGARRLTREGVLTRHIHAIETLGATSVLCTDKTGTLTENRMTVTEMAVPDSDATANEQRVVQWTPSSISLKNVFHPLLKHAILASAPTPFDPMETAFHAMGQRHLPSAERVNATGQLVHSYALSPSLKAMSHVWQFEDSQERVVSAKGAPEAIMDLCHLNEADRHMWSSRVESMAQKGLRVLAVASGTFQGDDYPATPHGYRFEWRGLIGLTDPLRPQIPQAVADCQSAGIQVIMITGDYPATAREIARQAGLPEGDILTGGELDKLSEPALRERLSRVTVCARISPHQKLRIVQALQAQGEVVAMTGDGVNDAPALQVAHVGVAMGARGTDVAREAADLVLVDDNFASIVGGIRVGRRIFSNLQKSMRYIFAIHIPIAGIALVPMVMGWPAMLLPLHVALLELIIDPTCAIAFENEPADADVMQRPPRDTRAALFGAHDMTQALGQGLCLLACVGLSYAWSTGSMAYWIADWESMRTWAWPLPLLSPEQSRSMVFITLIVGNAALVLTNRAQAGRFWASWRRPNFMAYAMILLALGLLVLAIHWPWLATGLQLAPLPPTAWGVALSLGLVSLLAIHGLQWLHILFQRARNGQSATRLSRRSASRQN